MDKYCGYCKTEMFLVERCLACESMPRECPSCTTRRAENDGFKVVNCKKLIVAFKEDVPPLVSEKGITLHLPDIVEEWEESSRLVTWGELFGLVELMGHKDASEQLRNATLNLIKSKEFQCFADAAMDDTCDYMVKLYKSTYGNEQGGEEGK